MPDCLFGLLANQPFGSYIPIDSGQANHMKQLFALLLIANLFRLGTAFAACVSSSRYTFDEHGAGYSIFYYTGPDTMCTNNTTSVPYSVGPDPSGGITNRPVLIYATGDIGTVAGDVALFSTNASGPNVITHLIRFTGEIDPQGARVIFYAADNSGSLADKGIPPSSNPVLIQDHPGGSTYYSPSAGQPGYGSFGFFQDYIFYTEPVSPVYVLSTNKLSISLNPGAVTISWSTNATNFTLYHSTNIFRATNLTAVTNTPLISEDKFNVALPLSQYEFFRLQYP
jgi:hypothetical protein